MTLYSDIDETNLADGYLVPGPPLRFRTASFVPLLPGTLAYALNAPAARRFCSGAKFPEPSAGRLGQLGESRRPGHVRQDRLVYRRGRHGFGLRARHQLRRRAPAAAGQFRPPRRPFAATTTGPKFAWIRPAEAATPTATRPATTNLAVTTSLAVTISSAATTSSAGDDQFGGDDHSAVTTSSAATINSAAARSTCRCSRRSDPRRRGSCGRA